MKNRNKALLLCGATFATLACIALAQDQRIQAVIGNVFLQNLTPGTAQAGHANISGTFRAGQVFVQQSSTTTVPIVGNSTAVGPGTAVGGSFSSGQLNGIAVRGTATAPAMTGAGTGVLGESRSVDGVGVVGRNTSPETGGSPDGAGVAAIATNSAIPALRATHTDGAAIIATTAAGSNSAVSATNTGTGVGVSGSGRIGVRGSSSLSGEMAGHFLNSSADGIGVLGQITGAQTGTGIGVYGIHGSASGWAVFAQGRLGASGAKLFIIDHPSDPENKTLSHYCTEGAEPLNVYSGSTRTDARGYATVRLPDYFSSINRDPRIQLTVVDESDSATFVQAKVVRLVRGNLFTLRTSGPNVQVFWRVEAVRSDRWMQKNGAPVEEAKDEVMRGYYLEPSLYGQPESKGRVAAYQQYNLRKAGKQRSGP